MIAESQKDLGREDNRGPADPSVASLLSEIGRDFQRLLKQHLELFKHEVREDIRKTKSAAIAMAGAYLLAWLGLMLVCAMLIGLLAWAVPQIAWWAWAGILAVVIFIASAALLASAKKMVESITPVPDETAKAIKEDIQWLKR